MSTATAAVPVTQTPNANVISRRLTKAGHFRYFFAHGFHVTTAAPDVVEIAVTGYTEEGREEEVAEIATTLTDLGYNAAVVEHTFETSAGRTLSYPIVRVTA
jgi:hypothetical protein